MHRSFYTIMAAQFFSSLADNALLIAAIALLKYLHEPAWMTPLLKSSFVLSYVVLAAWVGAFADSMPKGKVMLITNSIKIFGCGLMFLDVHPLLAYAVVGLGAAAYSPAKYGILTELLPADKLVVANGWIEGLTVLSIILGAVLGGQLVGVNLSTWLLSFDMPGVETGVDTPTEAALLIIGCLYIIAAVFNHFIPHTGVSMHAMPRSPVKVIKDFYVCNKALWSDKLGKVTLATTTLFWSAGATLQFIVIEWANINLGYKLDKATQLMGVVAVGIGIGAVLAARMVKLRDTPRVIPMGIAMGLVVMLMIVVHDWRISIALLIIVGALAGFFVVPMNALLQHRGHSLMGAGHSIAVQNFNENLGILIMQGVYALLIAFHVHLYFVIVMFGLLVSCTMCWVRWQYKQVEAKEDLSAYFADAKH
jgi:MFS transporter, LPLT family, lysophospholipid transporter